VTFSNATKDNVTVRRLFSGAAEGEEVKALWVESDYSATNAYFAPSGKAKKAARDMVRYHLKRASREKAAPDGFDEDAYLANIEALFAEIDATLGEGEGA